MAETSLTGYAVRIGVVVLSLAMIYFMLGRPDLYPLWTVGLIAFMGVIGAVSLVRAVVD
jgi:hypothetical protein